MGHPNCFGIRHLSPAGAYHLRSFLDEKQPDLILVEGPSDFNGLMDDMVREETKPPFAVMALLRTLRYARFCTPLQSTLRNTRPLSGPKNMGRSAGLWTCPRMCFWESGGPGRPRRPRNIRPALGLSMCTGFWTGLTGRTAMRPSGNVSWSTQKIMRRTGTARTPLGGSCGS